MIRYKCPKCKQTLTAQDREAGTKLQCPNCNQRLKVPVPPPNKTMLGTLEDQTNKTVLGKLEIPAEPSTPASEAEHTTPPPIPRTILVESPPSVDALEPFENLEDERPRRRRRPRYDEDEEYDDRPRRLRRSYRPCPRCGCTDYPRQTTKFAGASLALLIVGIIFWPLIIVAFFMQEKWDVCPDCGEKLRQTGTGF